MLEKVHDNQLMKFQRIITLEFIKIMTISQANNPNHHVMLMKSPELLGVKKGCVCLQWEVMNTLLWLITTLTTRKWNCYIQQHLLRWSTAMPRLPITEFQRLFASNRLHFANG